ncbi:MULTISPECIES: hypothetical protein [unclassified Herbaspirillum]|uniref:hypothetical protein n=1 Tax=unclassified Herbaspirillum TaxID=2624150 RepID=UPI000E2F65F0|nr:MULTISPECIES: hypothetical protein [unclassified Herbaspirillum]RFB73111.1 hypothetical protein DZB54_02000 [Herbaspirillum sp. 3R-3a1]TFI11081.1 hypothetical protein E4P32_06170 [Herbaspirillum sp. 3R11]TFI16989.1 hypothetical protein E4P31_06170 [Herbaspirillum sp. 3R-11]TFI24158.1 hypothetical protein E4P30_16025 [Herbaspirillum sp. 3C11]
MKTMYTEEEKDLIVRFKMAEAKAMCSNEYSFLIAILASAVVYLKWDNWFYPIIVFGLTIYWVGRAEQKIVDKMEPAYDKLMDEKYSDDDE